MQTHWLEEQIERLVVLAGRTTGRDGNDPFLAAIRQVVELAARCDGVAAAFSCHDGLVFATAGRTPDFEALAAVAHSSLAAAKEAARTVSLGRPGQMVLVGQEHKLALFPVGQLVLGILAPASVNLARALAKSPPPEKGNAMPRSLLVELGGRDAIEAVVALFYQRVLHDTELAPFFRDVSLPRLQQLQTDFFCAALDGQPWRGRDLKTVHAGMAITGRQFDRTARHLHAALEEAGVLAFQLEQVLALVASLRSQIVSDGASDKSDDTAAS